MPILEFLKDLTESPGRVATAEELSAIQQEALEKFEEGSSKQKLVPEAEQEAQDAGMDPKSYITILKLLSNSALLKNKILLNNALKQYKQAYKTPQEMIQDGELNSLAQNYHRLRDKITLSELLLANSSAQELAENPNHRSTFVHRLIENNVKREDLEHYLKVITSEYNKDLYRSYFNLSDNNGITVSQLLKRESGPQGKYPGLLGSVVGIIHLINIPTIEKTTENPRKVTKKISVDTHTESIHSSVDRSLLRLAQVYDPSLNIENNAREVQVNRNAEWSKRIDADIANLERKLRSIISSEASIDEFLAPTLLKIEKIEEAREEFKFHAETALRLIEGLKDGSYGNRFNVSANEPVSCGLTPKEVIAISFASLNDLENWNNPQAEAGHFKDFIHHLYIAKRGYNIDKYGDKEWQSHGSIADGNKCTGGMVNEIANGLRDHKLVEIKIVTPETMKGPISTKLPDILNELYSEESKNRDLLNSWISNGVISSELASKILEKLQRDKEFSSPFSIDEINKIGEKVLRQYSATELKALTESKYHKIFKRISLASHDVRSFVFSEGRGYVQYLEHVYNNNPDQFKELLKNILVGDDNSNQIVKLLLCSHNEEMRIVAKEVFADYLKEFSVEEKNKLLIESVENNHLQLIDELIKAGANVNAADLRRGHAQATALHYAAREGNCLILEKLIKAGADVNAVNLNGEMPTHMAARQNNLEVIEKLVKAGADVNFTNKFGRTVIGDAILFLRIEEDKPKVIAKLIEKGAYSQSGNNTLFTSLLLANALFNFIDPEELDDRRHISVHKCSKDIYSNILDLLVEKKETTVNVIQNHVKRASGWVEDSPQAWKFIEDLVNKIPQNERLEVISKVLEQVDNTSRRDRLVNMLPEHERNLARANVPPTMWEAIREVSELMHGNSSAEVPERNNKRSLENALSNNKNKRNRI